MTMAAPQSEGTRSSSANRESLGTGPASLGSLRTRDIDRGDKDTQPLKRKIHTLTTVLGTKPYSRFCGMGRNCSKGERIQGGGEGKRGKGKSEIIYTTSFS